MNFTQRHNARKRGWIVALLCFLLPIPASSAPLQHFSPTVDSSTTNNEELALSLLDEANDYLTVLPEKSMSIIKQHRYLLDDLSFEDQARWYLTQVLAAIKLSTLDDIEQGLRDFARYSDSEYYLNNQIRALNALGVWFRRSGFYKHARMAYLCNLDLQTEDRDKVISMLNLAVVERNLSNYQNALSINFQALELAEQIEEPMLIAAINNNMGIIAYNQGNYLLARQQFSEAMFLNQTLQRRYSEILNGNNLLLTFLIQQKYDLFDRLAPRLERLLKRVSDNPRKAYLAILLQLRQHPIETAFDQAQLSMLSENLDNLNDIGIQALLQPVFAQYKLDGLIKIKTRPTPYTGDLHLQYPTCDWQKYDQEIDSNMLISQ